MYGSLQHPRKSIVSLSGRIPLLVVSECGGPNQDHTTRMVGTLADDIEGLLENLTFPQRPDPGNRGGSHSAILKHDLPLQIVSPACAFHLFVDLQVDRRRLTTVQLICMSLAEVSSDFKQRDESEDCQAGTGCVWAAMLNLSSQRPRGRRNAWPLRYICKIQCMVQGELHSG